MTLKFQTAYDLPNVNSKIGFFEFTVWPCSPLDTIEILILGASFCSRHEVANYVSRSRKLIAVIEISVNCYIINRVITRVFNVPNEDMHRFLFWRMANCSVFFPKKNMDGLFSPSLGNFCSAFLKKRFDLNGLFTESEECKNGAQDRSDRQDDCSNCRDLYGCNFRHPHSIAWRHYGRQIPPLSGRYQRLFQPFCCQSVVDTETASAPSPALPTTERRI